MGRDCCIAGLLSGRASLSALLIILSGIVSAAEWTISPSLNVRESYNDNIRLTTLKHPNVTTTTIQPKVDFGWATERTNINLLGDWRYNRYAGDPNLKNRTDSTYKLKSAYKTELSEFFLDANYVNDTTLQQEEYNEDIGQTLTQEDRLSKQLAPAWSWNLNEQTNLRFDLQYQDVAYEKSILSSYNDYTYDSAGVTYTYRWTERDQVYVIVNNSRYESKKRPFILANEMVSFSRYIGSNSNTKQYQAGIRHQFSSTSTMQLLYGQRYTDSQTLYQVCTQVQNFPPPCLDTGETQTSSSSKSPVYTFSYDKGFELTKFDISLSRTVIGSGLGSEMDTDSLNLNVTHQLTEKTTLGFKFMGYQRIAVNPDFSRNDQTYFRGDIKLGWRLDRNWSLSTFYRHTRQKYKSRDAIATSNNISLNIRYVWDKLSKSR